MKIGILADNHGELEPVQDALRIFERQGVEVIVHCGDLCDIETLEILSSLPCWFVWGNMDLPDQSWRSSIEEASLHWPTEVPVVFDAEGRKIAVCHGHESVFSQVCESQQYDYVLHGHTHRQADHRFGSTRIINPGALYRVKTKTVAVLDTASDDLAFFDVRFEFEY